MFAPEKFRWAACVLIIILWSVPAPVHAQLKMVSSPHERVVEDDIISHYLMWEGNESIQGLGIRIPSGWSVKGIQIADDAGRFDGAAILKAILRTDAWVVRSDGDLIQPGQRFRLILQAGDAEKAGVQIVPITLRQYRWLEQPAEGIRQEWDVVTFPSRATNTALILADDRDSAPTLRTNSLGPNTSDSWTLAFWMRSTGLDQIVLSSWTGYESDAYPIEAILDEAGHVTVFTGRNQQHFAMRTVEPVADGTWHHVAVVHDALNKKMRLHFDGIPQDSLQFSGDAQETIVFPDVRLGYRLENSRTDLSDPFVGELDEIQLFDHDLSAMALDRIRTGNSIPGVSPVWHAGFNENATDDNVVGVQTENLTASILSFRKPASDLQAQIVSGGVTLSFLPGDNAVERYQIDVSIDGRSFRTATTIERDEAAIGRIEWIDRMPSGAVQHYRVTAIYEDGPEETSPVIKVGMGTDETVSRVHLEGNFPNPFNPTTTIRYEVLETEHVRVSIWDLSGQMIAQPVDASHQPGRYEVGFDAGTLPSGTYFVRLESPSGIQTHQMILMK